MGELKNRHTSRIAPLVALTALIVLSVPRVALSLPAYQSPTDRIVFQPKGTTLMAERADSPELRARGLMFRTSLGKNKGMIFCFDEAALQTFWMYNTKIPLTIIFLNERLEIVDIQDMEPCSHRDAQQCMTYTSRQAAKYAIEVNRGFPKRHGIRIGGQVTIERGE